MISVIVPVFNEARALPHSLPSLLAQSGDYEVIVVDGGSTDGTCEIVQAHPRVRLLSAPKGRATQMNAGARVARGELLLFLHADTLLPDGAIVQLDALAPEVEAGAHRHRFTPENWQLRLISAVNNWRCRLTSIYYGDQAIFVRRSLFHRLGGFPQVPMLEDVMLCERLRRVTKPLLLGHAVSTDARRFVRQGIWRSALLALLILARHKVGLPIRGRGFYEDVR